MKILVVSQYFYPERFTVNDIVFKLKEYGHDVTVLTGKPNYGYEKIIDEYKKIKYEEVNGVKIHRVNLYPRKKSRISIIKNYLSFWRNSTRYVNKLDDDFDVVLSFSLSPVISINAAGKYAKKHHIKHILYCMDLWPESTTVTGAIKKNSLAYKILYKWSKKLYNTCDKIIVSSPSFVDYFKNELHVEKEFKFIPQPGMLPVLKNDPIVYKNKYNIVYAGNIGTIQLVDKLVLSFKDIKEDIKLHLIGMGTYQDKINNLIKDNNLEDNVVYLGPKQVEETIRYYINADALVVSLSKEGTVGKTIPAKLSQYLYFKKPILGIISGDGKDLLLKTGGAILVDEDISSIKEGIEQIIKLSPKQKLEMGENNHAYYQKNLTLEKIVRSIEEELK